MTDVPRQLLVLGGTRFVGRAVVSEALALGHHVTLFNRGVTNPELFPHVEKLRGDRTSDLSMLEGRTWDAVIDVAAYDVEDVRRSVDQLREQVGHYVFVSTLSVYVDHSTPDGQREDAAVLELEPKTTRSQAYGAHKAASERVVVDAFGVRSTIARSGLIVGPHDPTDRFGYWPRRMALGGRVLAPGRPEDQLQFIDVRDLAAWLVRAASLDLPGTFNIVGRPTAFGRLLEACRAPAADAELAWISTDRLLDAGVDPWMGIPLWIAAEGWEAANAVPVGPATKAGLTYRPLAETVAGALAQPGYEGPPALSSEDEGRLLAASPSRGSASG